MLLCNHFIFKPADISFIHRFIDRQIYQLCKFTEQFFSILLSSMLIAYYNKFVIQTSTNVNGFTGYLTLPFAVELYYVCLT
jgi:hypothetical protein